MAAPHNPAPGNRALHPECRRVPLVHARRAIRLATGSCDSRGAIGRSMVRVRLLRDAHAGLQRD